ncbi:MAG: hypothetical protein MI919_42855 [Holophagales bacterium]|nr:hypothetical protein [Holophagales bacterium]
MRPSGKLGILARDPPAPSVVSPGELSFTDFVRSLEPGRNPNQEILEALLQRLRGVVVLELKRRALWSLGPRCLGVFGHTSWQEAGAVEELVADCYCFVFLERLGSLYAQAQVRSDVDGLVFRSISNFFYDLQKKHDPLGFRLFEVLQRAVRLCCEEGHLHVVAGDPRVRSDTVLGFDMGTPSSAWPEQLELRVQSWNDELLPGLVTARGRELEGLIERLAEKVEGLGQGRAGVESFAFGRVLQALKAGARRRWNAIWSHSEGAPAETDHGIAEEVSLRGSFEQREAFEKLVRCVDLSLERETPASKRSERLRRLWAFLRHQAIEDGDPALVSRRRLSKLLDIPRDSLPGLLARLGKLIDACRARLSTGFPRSTTVPTSET